MFTIFKKTLFSLTKLVDPILPSIPVNPPTDFRRIIQEIFLPSNFLCAKSLMENFTELLRAFSSFIFKIEIRNWSPFQHHSNFNSFACGLCSGVTDFFGLISLRLEDLLSDGLKIIFFIFWNGVSKKMVKAMDDTAIAMFSLRLSWNDTNRNEIRSSAFLFSTMTHSITKKTEVRSMSHSANVKEENWKLC